MGEWEQDVDGWSCIKSREQHNTYYHWQEGSTIQTKNLPGILGGSEAEGWKDDED